MSLMPVTVEHCHWYGGATDV